MGPGLRRDDTEGVASFFNSTRTSAPPAPAGRPHAPARCD